MSNETYIGHRYVPQVEGEWSNNKAYEELSIVLYEGNSYTSKQKVPEGVDINNTNFWALSGNYNAQMEQLRQDTNEQLAQTIEDINRATSELTVDSEVILARGDKLVLNDRLNEMDVKIATPHQDVTVAATNLVENGDFSKGTSGWLFDATLSNTVVLDGKAVTSVMYTGFPLHQKISIAKNNEYLLSMNVFIADETVTSIPAYYVGFGSTNKFDTAQRVSLRERGLDRTDKQFTIRIKANDDFDSLIVGQRLNSSTQMSFTIHSVSLINLTETFGEGNEPTKEQMDMLLTQFPNSWFEGTVNIYNSKHMMNIFFKELTKLNNALITLGGNF